MSDAALDNSYSWDQSVREIYRKLAQTPPDTPHYQKLALLAQLKAAETGENTAHTVADYTKQLTILTWFIAGATVLQAIVATLAYIRPFH